MKINLINIIIKKFFSLAISLIFVGLPLTTIGIHASYSQDNAASLGLTDSIPIDSKVTVGKLSNGLTYYLKKNGKPEKRVELRLVVKAGSMQEDDDQLGLAHFVEHMAFNGSTHFNKHELISYLQSIGIKFGADLNAYTRFDETVYILPIPTDNRDNLQVGFDILYDWAQGINLNDADIDKERDIILEEARLGKGASDRINKVLLPEVFNGSRYAQRLPIGKEDIIKNAPYEALKRYYKDWYRPDLMAVVVVGDINTAEAEKMVKEHFSGLKNPNNERPRVYAQIPPRTGSSALVITDKESTSDIVRIRYSERAKQVKKVIGDYRADIVRHLVLKLLEARINELSGPGVSPFQRATSTVYSIAPGYESFESNVELGALAAEQAIALVVEENERARQLGFSADELERGKKNYLRSIENTFNERDKLPSSYFVSTYINNFLMGEAIPGLENEFSYVKAFIPLITLEEINQMAHQIIPHTEDKLIVYSGNMRLSQRVASKEQLIEAVSKAENRPVIAKKEIREKIIPTKLMTVLPTPGKIISDAENAKLGTHELLLSNGVKVILKPTDFQNDQVLLSARRFGGESLYQGDDIIDARHADTIINAMGLGAFRPSDVVKILAGRSVSVTSNLNLYAEEFSGYASSKDIEPMLQIVNLRTDSPNIDFPLFDGFIRNSQERAKNKGLDPTDVLIEAVWAEVYNHHSRAPHYDTPEDFAKVRVWRSAKIFHERFGSVKDLVFIIVGSFDIEKIKPLIATYIASLPTGDIVTNYKDLGIRPTTGIVKKEVFSGSEHKSHVSINFTGNAIFSNVAHDQFSALIEILKIKMIDVLREKLTLIYSGNIVGELVRIPYPHYTISMAFPCKPENADQAIEAMLVEIEKIKKNGPERGDLDKVKQNWRKQYQIDVRTNQYWLDKLQDAALYHTDPEEILQADQRIDALDQAGIQAAAKKYFNTQNYVQVVLYPEKK